MLWKLQQSNNSWKACIYAFCDLWVRLDVKSLQKYLRHVFSSLFDSWLYSAKKLSRWKAFLVVIFRNSRVNRRTPAPKCDFNKAVLQFYWNHISAWCSPLNLLYIFRTPFLKTPPVGCFWILVLLTLRARILA